MAWPMMGMVRAAWWGMAVLEWYRVVSNEARLPAKSAHGQAKLSPCRGDKGRNAMSRKLNRRQVMAGTAAGVAAAAFKFPTPAIAQAKPFKLGLLTIKTGPLAQ